MKSRRERTRSSWKRSTWRRRDEENTKGDQEMKKDASEEELEQPEGGVGEENAEE